jgi:hypothetical protein
MRRGATVADAAFALLRVARGEASGLSIDTTVFDRLDWHRLVSFTTSHCILQALARPLATVRAAGVPVPEDLLAFAEDFEAANIARNTFLLTETAAIIDTLNKGGLIPVVLKGVAFLVDDPAARAWRFMRDVDLLVPASDLGAAVERLERLGFARATDDYDPEHEAHFPPLVSPCRTYSVELHTRLFGRGAHGIDVERLAARARPMSLGAATIAMPHLDDRIAHLLAHAQLHNRGHVARRLVLKDVLDLAMLPEGAVRAFATHRDDYFTTVVERGATSALIDASRRCLGQPACHAASAPPAWARAAIERLRWPRWRHLAALPGDVLRLEALRWRDEAGHRDHRLRQLRSSARLGDAARTALFKHRQRLWS